MQEAVKAIEQINEKLRAYTEEQNEINKKEELLDQEPNEFPDL